MGAARERVKAIGVKPSLKPLELPSPSDGGTKRLLLDEAGIERVELAPVMYEKAKQLQLKAPWEELEEKEADLKRKHNAIITGSKNPSHREGVVYKESYVKELAKKGKIKLSPAALERLEAAAQ